MSLLVRIVDFGGGNPVVFDKAKNKIIRKALNSADEGISFKIAKNDLKANVINPELGGYAKFWEVWETSTNQRINYGPLSEITEQGTDWSIKGNGRSALLNDFISTHKTIRSPILRIVDSLRFENLAIEPRTSAIVHDGNNSADNTTVFDSVDIDDKYAGLSFRTKEFIIDDDTGLLRPGEIDPVYTFRPAQFYWSGMGKSDTIIIDLGQVFDISKITMTLPWWASLRRANNRSYDFEIAYATDTELPITTVQGKPVGPFHTIFVTESPNKLVSTSRRTYEFLMGTDNAGMGTEAYRNYLVQDQSGPIYARYIRVYITNTYGWYLDLLGDASADSINGWNYECDPNYVNGDVPGLDRDDGVLNSKTISDVDIDPSNDCHAGVVEIGIHKSIINRDSIKQLALQRIDNNNLQISYSHTPVSGETITTSQGYRKFEPGSLFRNFTVNYSGANSSYTKFYDSDCANCYPDTFSLGILDQNNTMVYDSDSSSGTVSPKVGVFTKHILMKGASNATVTHVDAWPAKSDILSWGASYSYTEVAGDTATVHFRGESFKWYATIPSDKTGAEVSIELRKKNNSTGLWEGWQTLESSLFLPSDISSTIVYEISYESHLLESDTVYEFRITNIDGNFCSIDSFEGYWSSSLTSYNEDSTRFFVSRPDRMSQIYDKRFSAGSIFKWNNIKGFVDIHFTGDRVLVFSAKGRFHGKLRFFLSESVGTYDGAGRIFIPGGDPVNGSLVVNLNTGKRGVEVAQAVVFDSNDYFPNGLKWSSYALRVGLYDEETYQANVGDLDSNTFVERCESCNPSSGNTQETQRFVYFDGAAIHEDIRLSVSFENETNLEQLKSIANILQSEWDITERGLLLDPRIGEDTEVILREGTNTLVDWTIVNDIEEMASILVSSGADIDGLPLFTITEDKRNRNNLGRTVMRRMDFRDVADYFNLIGLSRTELKKRSKPSKRITVTHIGYLPELVDLGVGDSFILYTKKMGKIRVRIDTYQRSEDESAGTEFQLECIPWPQIV